MKIHSLLNSGRFHFELSEDVAKALYSPRSKMDYLTAVTFTFLGRWKKVVQKKILESENKYSWTRWVETNAGEERSVIMEGEKKWWWRAWAQERWSFHHRDERQVGRTTGFVTPQLIYALNKQPNVWAVGRCHQFPETIRKMMMILSPNHCENGSCSLCEDTVVRFSDGKGFPPNSEYLSTVLALT